MAESNAVGLVEANAPLHSSVLQQYVRVFQTSAKKHTHMNVKTKNRETTENKICRHDLVLLYVTMGYNAQRR